MSGKFLHGALIQFTQTALLPVPNVIVFQFNPETIQHSWKPAETRGGSNPLATSGEPGETFGFKLAMDSNDMIADGSAVANGIAQVSGIYTRLAALEMLLYPTGSDALGGLLKMGAGALGIGGSAKKKTSKVPVSQLPVVIFVWGPARIVPVKVSRLSITETLYDDKLLNPIHAEADIELTVMTPADLKQVTGPLGPVAKVAYEYSQTLRQTLAVANLANSAESVIGMLPI